MRRLKSIEEWKNVLEQSEEESFVIFKHSNSCGSSIKAHAKIAKLPKADQERIFLVVVQDAQEVSRAIEDATGITHESPQLLLIKNKRAVLAAHHYGVTEIVAHRMLE